MGERRQGAVMQNNDGRLESVVAGQDGVLHHCWQRVAGAAFGGWWVINGPWPGCPALVANADGRPETSCSGRIAPNAALVGWRWHGESWGVGTDPVVARAGADRLVVALRDEAGIVQTAPNGDFGPP
jgi:hypothetical protein